MEDLIIQNPRVLERLKKAFAEGGAKRIHVVSDFDRTLTKAFVNGVKRPSMISILRDGDYITPEYRKKAHELASIYHPIEMDPTVPLEKKKRAMHEWWTRHFNLLIECGLNKKDIERVAQDAGLQLRDGAKEFFKTLKENDIPLLIISSNGIGDGILMYLKNQGVLYSNVYVITNTFEYDTQGKVARVREPIIHNMNKDEASIKGYPLYRKISERKNIILLGDSIDDIGMVAGSGYENLIKVGFLNEQKDKHLPDYKKYFDVIVLNDGPMDHVNGLLKEFMKR